MAATGNTPAPPKTIRPHLVYKGHIIVRYWYLVVPAIVSILMAFLLAERIVCGD